MLKDASHLSHNTVDKKSDFLQEIGKGKTMVCGTLCIDHSGQELLARVANRVYEDCRSGVLSLPAFPDFAPLVNALKCGNTADRSKSFRVSAQQHDRLLVLESYAKKWLNTESTQERAQKLIDEHNAEYNPVEQGGQFWIAERTDLSLHPPSPTPLHCGHR